MGPIKYFKSLCITVTLVLIFLSSIPSTETWKPDNQVVRTSKQSTKLEVIKASQNEIEDKLENDAQKSPRNPRRIALSLITREVDNDFSEPATSDNFETSNPIIGNPSEGFSTSTLSKDNFQMSEDATLSSQTSKSVIEDLNLEADSSEFVVSSSTSEESIILTVIAEKEDGGSSNVEIISQNEAVMDSEGDSEGLPMEKNGSHSRIGELNFQGPMEDSEADANEIQVIRDPCETNHDDFFASTASRLYTKGPKLAYAYIAGLWLTAFFMKIVNSVRRN